MFPLKYNHVFIPILPSSLIDFVSSPTPFIMGLHSLYKNDVTSDILDVIFVDLDGGSIKIPDNFQIHTANELMLNKLYFELSLVLKPDLEAADLAFSATDSIAQKSLFSLDKHLRAAMLRFFVMILDGYRSCLTIVRIHPECNMTFHKAAFLGLHDPNDYTFLKKFLDSVSFGSFVTERGPPWRKCDVYDELQSGVKSLVSMSPLSPGSAADIESQKSSVIAVQIHELASKLHHNEDPSLKMDHLQYQNIPVPASGAMRRVHQPMFPVLNDSLVSMIISDATAKLHTSTASPQ